MLEIRMRIFFAIFFLPRAAVRGRVGNGKLRITPANAPLQRRWPLIHGLVFVKKQLTHFFSGSDFIVPLSMEGVPHKAARALVKAGKQGVHLTNIQLPPQLLTSPYRPALQLLIPNS
jgi:hypothetical protein